MKSYRLFRAPASAGAFFLENCGVLIVFHTVSLLLHNAESCDRLQPPETTLIAVHPQLHSARTDGRDTLPAFKIHTLRNQCSRAN